jgi:hypothetical protein
MPRNKQLEHVTDIEETWQPVKIGGRVSIKKEAFEKREWERIAFATEAEMKLVNGILTENSIINEYTLLGSIQNSDVAGVQQCISNGVDVNFRRTEPLQVACIKGNPGVVKLLVEAGADIHARNDDAICHAVYNNNEKVIKYLIEQGADVNAQDGFPLKIAFDRTSSSLVDLLIKGGADISRVEPYNVSSFAVQQNNLNLIKTLIGKGFDIDIILGLTINFYSKDKNQLLSYLIKEGANITDDLIIKAIDRGGLITIKALVKNGADIFSDQVFPKVMELAERIGKDIDIDFFTNLKKRRDFFLERNQPKEINFID